MQLIQIGEPPQNPVETTIREMFQQMANREHQMVLAAREKLMYQETSTALVLD